MQIFREGEARRFVTLTRCVLKHNDFAGGRVRHEDIAIRSRGQPAWLFEIPRQDADLETGWHVRRKPRGGAITDGGL